MQAATTGWRRDQPAVSFRHYSTDALVTSQAQLAPQIAVASRLRLLWQAVILTAAGAAVAVAVVVQLPVAKKALTNTRVMFFGGPDDTVSHHNSINCLFVLACRASFFAPTTRGGRKAG